MKNIQAKPTARSSMGFLALEGKYLQDELYNMAEFLIMSENLCLSSLSASLIMFRYICHFALPGTTFSPLQVYGKIILSLKGKQLRSE